MEYREIKRGNDKSPLYVSVELGETWTEFDSGITRSLLRYYKDKPRSDDALYELKVSFTQEFIDDTYRLRRRATDNEKIKAFLDIGERAYESKLDALKDIESVDGVRADSPLSYAKRINMQSVKLRQNKHE